VWYIDTSAFLKLVVLEEESEAMRAWFRSHSPVWSSQLLLTESMRSAGKLGIDRDVVFEALESVSLVLPSVETFYTAGEIGETSLRSLDAIHLATALEMGVDLTALVTYDERLAEASRAAGVQVDTPV
jgi:predicted nucleic acid-binding protein